MVLPEGPPVSGGAKATVLEVKGIWFFPVAVEYTQQFVSMAQGNRADGAEPCPLGMDPHTALERTRHSTRLDPLTLGTDPQKTVRPEPDSAQAADETERERYALRIETEEQLVGQIDQGRGFRQFLPPGLDKVNREWLFICAGHNLLRLFRHGTENPSNAPGNGSHSNCRSPRLIVGKFLQILLVFTNPHCPTLVASS